MLVLGGGIGGLTAATAFAQRGVEVVLIARRPDFDVPGVGLGQPANALRVYDALGVLSEILKTGFTYDRMYMFDANREELIVEHELLLNDASVPATCALSRLLLHEIVLGAAERAGAQIRTGLTVSEIHDEKDRVMNGSARPAASDRILNSPSLDLLHPVFRLYTWPRHFCPQCQPHMLNVGHIDAVAKPHKIQNDETMVVR